VKPQTSHRPRRASQQWSRLASLTAIALATATQAQTVGETVSKKISPTDVQPGSPTPGVQPATVVTPDSGSEVRKAVATAEDGDHSWIPAYRTDPETWRDIVIQQVDQARQTQPNYVFIGDSITQGWDPEIWKTRLEPLGTCLNLGIGGDGPQHVLWRIDHGIVDDIKPKAVVLMIGINNFWRHYTPADTARGIETILDRLRDKLPQSRIIVVSILPAMPASDDIRAWTKEINQRIAKQDGKDRVEFLNVWDSMIEANGEQREGFFEPEDHLHLRRPAYVALAAQLSPVLQQTPLPK
jgi:lysophospholipase L1-like esterase